MLQYSYVFPLVYHHLIILLLLSESLPEVLHSPFAPAQPRSSTPVSEKVCKYSNRSALYLFHVMIVGNQIHHLHYSWRILTFMRRYFAETRK
jgi:hypothetical protein